MFQQVKMEALSTYVANGQRREVAVVPASSSNIHRVIVLMRYWIDIAGD